MVRAAPRTRLWVGVIVALVAALALPVTHPCRLLAPADILRVLGWTVAAGAERSYALPGGAGKMCTFDGRDGSVIVTIPSKGTGLPINDSTSDLGTARVPLHDSHGLGLPVELGHGSAIVHDRGRDYGISVSSLNADFADEAQMRALATALVTHLPKPHARHPG